MNFNSMYVNQLLVFICVLILACTNENVQTTKPNSTTDSTKVDNDSSILFTETITDINFWKYNNRLNELMNNGTVQERYKLAMKIDSSNISNENRNSFYLNFYFVLMDIGDFDRAVQVLRERYVNNPIPELSMNENLYMYYFWGTVIKLESSDCDSAVIYFKQLKNLPHEITDIPSRDINDEMQNLEKILNESCL